MGLHVTMLVDVPQVRSGMPRLFGCSADPGERNAGLRCHQKCRLARHPTSCLLLLLLHKHLFCTVENIVGVCRRKPWGEPAIRSLFFSAGGNSQQFVIRGLFCHGLWSGLIVQKGKDNQSCWHFENSNALLSWPQMSHLVWEPKR